MKKGRLGRPVSLLRFPDGNPGRPSGQPDRLPVLFGRGRHNVYRAELATKLAFLEGNAAVDEREQGMILAHADIGARIEFRAALTHQDVARNDDFAAELLHAE